MHLEHLERVINRMENFPLFRVKVARVLSELEILRKSHAILARARPAALLMTKAREQYSADKHVCGDGEVCVGVGCDFRGGSTAVLEDGTRWVGDGATHFFSPNDCPFCTCQPAQWPWHRCSRTLVGARAQLMRALNGRYEILGFGSRFNGDPALCPRARRLGDLTERSPRARHAARRRPCPRARRRLPVGLTGLRRRQAERALLPLPACERVRQGADRSVHKPDAAGRRWSGLL